MSSIKIIRMGYVIQKNLEDAKPKDLMPILIEKRIFQ